MKKLDQVELPEGFLKNEAGTLAFGTVMDYHVLVWGTKEESTFIVEFAVGAEDKEEMLEAFLQQFVKDHTYVSYAKFADRKVTAVIVLTSGNETQQLEETIRTIAAYLQVNALPEVCPYCGQEENGIYQLNNDYGMMCKECYARNVQIRENQNAEKTNLFLGIIGALAGALVGVAVWILLYQINFIAGISGFLMITFAFKGFRYMGKHLNKNGVILCIIISIIFLFFAEYISLGLEIYKAFKDTYDITIMQSIRSVINFLIEPEIGDQIKAGMIRDLLIGYGLMFLGSKTNIKYEMRKAKNEHVYMKLA